MNDAFEAVTRSSALLGKRRALSNAGWNDQAAGVSLQLIDLLSEELAIRDSAGASAVWETEIRWLAEHNERVGDYLSALEARERITSRYREPRLRWAGLLSEARLLAKAARMQDAYDRYAEARDNLLSAFDPPRDEWFLATEVEMLQFGVHRGVVSRQYLDDLAVLIARYAACGTCTLPHEFNLATGIMRTVGENAEERAYALDLLQSIIDRYETAIQNHESTPLFDHIMHRSAYRLLIGRLADSQDSASYRREMEELSLRFMSFYPDESDWIESNPWRSARSTGDDYKIGRHSHDVSNHDSPILKTQPPPGDAPLIHFPQLPTGSSESTGDRQYKPRGANATEPIDLVDAQSPSHHSPPQPIDEPLRRTSGMSFQDSDSATGIDEDKTPRSVHEAAPTATGRWRWIIGATLAIMVLVAAGWVRGGGR